MTSALEVASSFEVGTRLETRCYEPLGSRMSVIGLFLSLGLGVAEKSS